MKKIKIIILFLALGFVLGCTKVSIPKQFQDDRNPKPAMYEKKVI
jgi:hypothetical protein